MVLKPKEINRLSIIEQIQKEENLLSLPQTLVEILKEVDKEDVSADSLCKIIRNDPALTSRILKMANSTFYQRFSRTTTVQQAVSVLGITTVVCLALSSSVFRPEIIAKESGIDTTNFYTYVLSVAAACERIAKELELKASEEAFIIGLINDIGMLFFLHHYPEQFKKVLRLKTECNSLSEVEIKIFGIDHYEISSLLVHRWKLPETIADAVGLQKLSQNNERVAKLQDVLRLGMLLNPDQFSGFERPIEERFGEIHRISEVLGLSKTQMDNISSKLLLGTIEMAEHFGVNIGSVEELLIKANQEIWKAYLTIDHLFKIRQELSQQVLMKEHERGALEAKNISMATLFHYVNNSAMAIFGRSQIMRVHSRSGKKDQVFENMERDLDVIDKSIQKIVAVLEEVRELSPLNHEKLSGSTLAINLDDKLAQRISKMSREQKWFDDVATPKVTS